ncbi:MAG: hypothetical protein H0Z39_03845 [Peptococcaceae bacterium]|nr:hypothetical protein [Peptococcaceae bacterium]
MIRNGRSFTIGLVLAISFFLVLAAIYSPVFNGMNGLQFADQLFNSIAKGSTYFIPEVKEQVDGYRGQVIDVTITLDSTDDAAKAAVLFEKSGAQVQTSGSEVKINGDLGNIAAAVVNDADAMFNNEGDIMTEKYGYHKKDAMYHWWLALHEVDSVLKKQGAFKQASFVDEIVKRAVEPAYNFYGVKPERVSDFAGTVTGMLVFYIIYTVWWGFAIYFLFEGLGLNMSKAAHKEEV